MSARAPKGRETGKPREMNRELLGERVRQQLDLFGETLMHDRVNPEETNQELQGDRVRQQRDRLGETLMHDRVNPEEMNRELQGERVRQQRDGFGETLTHERISRRSDLRAGYESGMDLRAYLEILWRRKWVILITAIVSALVTAVGVSMMPLAYEASTTLRIGPAAGASGSYTEILYAGQLRDTFALFATSDLVLDRVAQRLGLGKPPKVRTEMLGNSQLLRLTVTDPDPRVAQEAADTTAEVLMDLHRELYIEAVVTAREALGTRLAQTESELNQARTWYESINARFPDEFDLIQAATSELEVKRETYTLLLEQYEEVRAREVVETSAFSVFSPADLPEDPAGLPRVLYVALGFVAGLAAGVGLSFLFENLDGTLHTAEQIEAVTQLSTLGKIPSAGRRQRTALINGRLPQAEAFRRLRMNLYALDGSAPQQVLLVTSAEPAEGKTTIVASLANSVAESGRKVVAVDCNLRRPALQNVFGLENKVGLSSILQQQASCDVAIEPTEIPRLYVLVAGPSAPKPAELLGSRVMTELIEELRQHFDLILLDAPAIAAVTDAALLAPVVDGVVLVVRRAKAGAERVRAACQHLADVRAKLLGVVVNEAEQAYGYQYYYERA